MINIKHNQQRFDTALRMGWASVNIGSLLQNVSIQSKISGAICNMKLNWLLQTLNFSVKPESTQPISRERLREVCKVLALTSKWRRNEAYCPGYIYTQATQADDLCLGLPVM